MKAILRFKGGPGSGFHGHAGRPGEVGGSQAENTVTSLPIKLPKLSGSKWASEELDYYGARTHKVEVRLGKGKYNVKEMYVSQKLEAGHNPGVPNGQFIVHWRYKGDIVKRLEAMNPTVEEAQKMIDEIFAEYDKGPEIINARADMLDAMKKKLGDNIKYSNESNGLHIIDEKTGEDVVIEFAAGVDKKGKREALIDTIHKVKGHGILGIRVIRALVNAANITNTTIDVLAANIPYWDKFPEFVGEGQFRTYVPGTKTYKQFIIRLKDRL